MEVVAFTKVRLPYGWLGNMSPHAVRFEADDYSTAEALFQALRFDDRAIRREIRERRSPMAAKMHARTCSGLMTVVPRSAADVENMRLVLELKLAQHPGLATGLIATGDARIVEDCTRRQNESGLFWGAAVRDGVWYGRNMLGTLWEELRADLRRRADAKSTVET